MIRSLCSTSSASPFPHLFELFWPRILVAPASTSDLIRVCGFFNAVSSNAVQFVESQSPSGCRVCSPPASWWTVSDHLSPPVARTSQWRAQGRRRSCALCNSGSCRISERLCGGVNMRRICPDLTNSRVLLLVPLLRPRLTFNTF